MGKRMEKPSLRLGHASTLVALITIAGKLAALPPPEAKPLTIERIAEERQRSDAMPKNLAWSSDGKHLGFIRTTLTPGKIVRGTLTPGVSNSEIWSIDTITGQEKILVSHAQLAAAFAGEHQHPAIGEEAAEAKRRRLQDFAWASGGHTLLLASATSLVWFDLDSHSSRPVVTQKPEGAKADRENLSSPQISPDGRFVSFIQDRKLWLANVADGALHAFAGSETEDIRTGELDWPYRHELGLKVAYWWSPDSMSIAFLETDDREVAKYSLRSADGDEESIPYPKPGGAIPKVRLLVSSLSGSPVSIDLGRDANVYIPRVQWLPDGKHLAVERLSRSQKTLELLLADAATGKTKTILTEKDDYWINLSDDLHFLKDSNRFLWSSERSGYRHLYLYDISGHQLAQLTKGDWEVTSLAGVDEAAGAVYFTATEASPLERQLYRVQLDGSGFARVTQGKGTHSDLFAPSGAVFLDTWSDHATSPRQDLMRVDGSKIGGIQDNPPSDAVMSHLSPVEFFTMKSHMGMDMNAFVIKPPDFDPARKYPVILYAAGGPGEQAVTDAWGGDKSLWFSLMAQSGYVIFALDNRGSAGHGHLFEEPIHLRFSGAEMADLRDGVLYLHNQPWVDKARIGICGWGFGGFLALHGMLDRPLLYKAGFAGSPITDWHRYDAVFTERYLEDPVRNQDGWLSSSPLENAGSLSGPLLLAQATLDEKAHPENSLMLLDELLDKGRYADILLFADRKDVFEDETSRKTMFQRLTDFFLKNL